MAHARMPMEDTIQFDPAPTLGATSPHLTTATGRMLELALNSDGGTSSLELQGALRALCQDARRQGMRAEQLIILFKQTWHARPEVQKMSRDESGRLFDSVVTMCVKEFYDGAR